jgi:hypothetical protein
VGGQRGHEEKRTRGDPQEGHGSEGRDDPSGTTLGGERRSGSELRSSAAGANFCVVRLVRREDVLYEP